MCLTEIVKDYGPIIVIIIAAIAAGGAWASAARTKKSVLSQIVLQLTEAYSSDDMLKSIGNIKNWKITYGDGFATRYKDGLKGNGDGALKLNRDRMRCTHYFDRVWKLKATKALQDNQVKKIVLVDQVDFYLTHIEPLEEALNPNYDKSAFDGFRELYKTELDKYHRRNIN